MHDVDSPWQHGVVLICNNQRPDGSPKPSCGRDAGNQLKAWLKIAAREGGGAAAECRVLTTSCLDVCPQHGVAVALMPGNEVVVVDPQEDRDALLARVQAHMDAVAEQGAPTGPGRRGRGLLRRLRGAD
ncbi:MAG: hypothetical protein D6798_13165 [Deltaproteobacteria bacterium]|nr:MAG: hypothetical protein D6798_13165 [Deltaproteobacteria bacterium]